MKKKLVILCLTAALSVSMLNGCGGKDNTKEQTGTSETTEESDQEAADKVAKLIDDIYVQERMAHWEPWQWVRADRSL